VTEVVAMRWHDKIVRQRTPESSRHTEACRLCVGTTSALGKAWAFSTHESRASNHLLHFVSASPYCHPDFSLTYLLTFKTWKLGLKRNFVSQP
jgi:hypothetical protein